MKVFNYTVLLEPAKEGGYAVHVPALPGCFTQGESIEEALEMAREAIQCHLLGLMKDRSQIGLFQAGLSVDDLRKLL